MPNVSIDTSPAAATAPSGTTVKRFKVPHVQVLVPDRRGHTVRPQYVPVYEVPLLLAVHNHSYVDSKVEILVTGMPGHLPDSMKYRNASRVEEQARLAARYGKHPETKEDIFEQHYGQGRFRDTFKRVVEGTFTLRDLYAVSASADDDSDDIDEAYLADDDIQAEAVENGAAAGDEDKVADEMRDIKRKLAIRTFRKISGVGDELAGAIFDLLGVTTDDELAALTPEDLEPVAGISLTKAKNILTQVQKKVAPPAPGAHPAMTNPPPDPTLEESADADEE